MSDDHDAITEPDLRVPVIPAKPAREKRVRQDEARKRLSWPNRLARTVLAVTFVAGFFFSVTPWGRAATRAVMLLPGIVAATQLGPIMASGEPIRPHPISLTVPSQGGTVDLDVWEPTSSPPPIPGAREGVLVLPGVGDERGEPQLINLMESLARAGLVAMAMTTPSLIAYDLSPQDSDAVVQAYLKLSSWPGVGAGRVGILGFSAGDALVSLAAADPRIQSRIAFLTFFGGYYNAEDLLRDVGRRALDVDGKLLPWQPNIVPLTVLANTLATTLPGSDGELISNAFNFNNPLSLSGNQVAGLSPPAQAAYHLLAGDEPDQADANLAALTPAMHTLLGQLSPSTVVAQIRAPIYLLHDATDPYVPFTESRSFAAALARLGHSYTFLEVTIFQHTEVRSSPPLGPLIHDGTLLYLDLYRLLLPST
jgi:dienelactone hydrolase